jgi:hypothetical protein
MSALIWQSQTKSAAADCQSAIQRAKLFALLFGSGVEYANFVCSPSWSQQLAVFFIR